MAEFYISQEAAFAPGIAGDWPDVIPKPGNKNGRLKRVHSMELGLDAIKSMLVATAATGKLNSDMESEVEHCIDLIDNMKRGEL